MGSADFSFAQRACELTKSDVFVHLNNYCPAAMKIRRLGLVSFFQL